MKNIIIGGTVRAGKTTLANLLRQRFGYSKVESDTIVNAFDTVYPDFGITHKKPELARAKYQPFLFEVLNGFCRDLKYANNVTVFPGAQFLPYNISRYEKLDKYIVIFLGFDNINPEDLLAEIRKNDTENDWTHTKTDEWMLKFCKNIINESELIKADCEKYGFYYFNTYHNRNAVLDNICNLVDALQN
ncbi:MAG: hypothetical protein J6Q15_01880 [Clostridia bacterium]|nr:hypothetical protein [Clostridia bacterium]